MAEGLFRDFAEKAGEDIKVASAGIGAMDGLEPSENSVTAMLEEEIDISSQRSQILTPPMIEEFTHIFGMARGHIDIIRNYFPESQEKTFVLREFLNHHELDLDVPDPIGMGMDEYTRCRNLIKEAMPGILKFVVSGELDS